MKKINKIIFGMGTIATVVAPAIGVVACGSTDNDNNKKIDGVEVKGMSIAELASNFGSKVPSFNGAVKNITTMVNDGKKINAIKFDGILGNDGKTKLDKSSGTFTFKSDKFFVNGDSKSKIENTSYLSKYNLTVTNGSLTIDDKTKKVTEKDVAYLLRMAIASKVEGFQLYTGVASKDDGFILNHGEGSWNFTENPLSDNAIMARGLTMSINQVENKGGKFSTQNISQDIIKFMTKKVNTTGISSLAVTIYDQSRNISVIHKNISFAADVLRLKSPTSNEIKGGEGTNIEALLNRSHLEFGPDNTIIKQDKAVEPGNSSLYMFSLELIGAVLNHPDSEIGQLNFSNGEASDLTYSYK